MKPKFLTRTASFPVFLCVTLTIADAAPSQPNSWTNSATAGFWQESNRWSLGVPPSSVNQAGIFITNSVSKTVTINSATPVGNLTINDLTLRAPGGLVNTLLMTNVSTATPLRILNGFTISTGGVLSLTNSALRVEGVNKLFLVDGSVTIRSGASIVATNTGTFTAVGNASSGSLTVLGGSLLASKLYMGLASGSRGTFTMSGGETKSTGLMCAGCRVGSTGAVWVTGGQLSVSNDFLEIGADGPVGQMTVSNGTVTIRDFTVGSFSGSRGTLTVAGGSFQTLMDFTAGYDPGGTGTVWLTGGQIGVASDMIFGYQPPSFGRITISNGAVTAQSAFIGNSRGLSGSLALYGGTMTVYSNMLVGYCPQAATGSVLIAGGSLYVTNASFTAPAVLDLSGGTLTLSSGLLVVDKFVVTNTCARFVFTGGTLLYTESVLSSNLDADGDGLPNFWEVQYGLGPLNPFGNNGASGDPDGDGMTNLQEFNAGTSPTNSASVFRITAITRESNNVRLTWKTAGGKTNQLQVATGNYSTNFVNLGPLIILPATTTVTNYLHLLGAATATQRFYRVRLVP